MVIEDYLIWRRGTGGGGLTSGGGGNSSGSTGMNGDFWIFMLSCLEGTMGKG